jgi:hypothetical protein
VKPVIGLVLIAGFATGQRVHFDSLERSVIEKRVLAVPKGNAARAAAVKQMLAAAGCQEPNLLEQTVKGSKIPNVICTLPGKGSGAIVVGAHTDSTGGGQGIIDNWSGAALLASLYETLAKAPRKRTFVFVGFTAEEKGLLGSRGFVKALSEDDRRSLRAAIVMDCLGLTPVKFWPNGSDAKLWNAWARLAVAMDHTPDGVNMEQVGLADSVSFKEAGLPVICLHSVTQETLSIINGQEDTVKAMKMDDYWQAYRVVSGYLVYLDSALP